MPAACEPVGPGNLLRLEMKYHFLTEGAYNPEIFLAVEVSGTASAEDRAELARIITREEHVVMRQFEAARGGVQAPGDRGQRARRGWGGIGRAARCRAQQSSRECRHVTVEHD